MTTRKMAAKQRLDKLREEIGNAIASKKSYDVPKFCVALGLLAEATDEDQTEAFRSKRSYVRPMLADLDEPALLRVAETVLEEVDYEPLQILLTEMTKHADLRVSKLVRKDVLMAINGAGPLFGDQALIDTISRIFGAQAVMGEELTFLSSRHVGPITQHYVRNDDWSHQDLLEHCGALDCPQTVFFNFLEAILHPMSRRDKEQADLAEAVSQCLRRDGFEVEATSSQSGYPIFEIVRVKRGVQGQMKNLIFASTGPKPELVFRDAVNNDVEITKNADKVLIFDRPIPPSGMLSWADLQAWWQDAQGIVDPMVAKKTLYTRMHQAVKLAGSPGELAIFRSYYSQFGKTITDPAKLPALIPQVYLHYDPYTIRQRGQEQVLARQRMDFLLLLENRSRVVIEVDGRHHYGEEVGGRYQASAKLYATMAAEDRRLRLSGYEVYRFGGHEFIGVDLEADTIDEASNRLVVSFFADLFKRHGMPIQV